MGKKKATSKKTSKKSKVKEILDVVETVKAAPKAVVKKPKVFVDSTLQRKMRAVPRPNK